MRVAEELGYTYVDQQLPVVVAKRLRIPPQVVDANEDAAPSLGERILNSLERATPELAQASADPPFDETLLRAVQQAVREYAGRGNAVIVGRGAFAILGAGPGTLRVFLHAPRAWRIARIVEAAGIRREAAEAEVDRIDRARATYIHEWYGVTFGDVRSYDLCIDTSRLDAGQSTAAIVAAVRTRPA